MGVIQLAEITRMNTPYSFTTRPSWPLCLLWAGYFTGLPAKGILCSLFELLLLIYAVVNWRRILPTWERYQAYFRWLACWAVPMLMAATAHLFTSPEPRELGIDMLQFALRSVLLATCFFLSWGE